ncbi:nitrilase-related carbon-nitrogen hydrolase [Acetobacter sp. AN02]|uniref:nitrilase-related carbon-nitrogen hydrolase n=1 Tax=Acetobacter sp. AN02 TaxID=2894186 RepID=UPI0024342108|nr:nitrilase-related carbon-nitrogen hydrolase [Acetobacter sp. AN02]
MKAGRNSMNRHRVAVIQAGTSLFDTPRTLDRMEAHCEAAAAQGVELAVFPEAYIGGYPKGLSFGAVLGTRFPETPRRISALLEIRHHRTRPRNRADRLLCRKNESPYRRRRDRARRRDPVLHGPVLRS